MSFGKNVSVEFPNIADSSFVRVRHIILNDARELPVRRFPGSFPNTSQKIKKEAIVDFSPLNFSLDIAVERVKFRPIIEPEVNHESSWQRYLCILFGVDIAWVQQKRGGELGKDQISIFAYRVEQFALVDGQGSRAF